MSTLTRGNSTLVLVSRNTLRPQGDAYIRDLSQSGWGNRAPTAAGKGPGYFARFRAQNSGEPEKSVSGSVVLTVDRTANPTLRHPGAGRDPRQVSARVLLRGRAERPTASQSGLNQSWVPASAGMTAGGGVMIVTLAMGIPQ
jgi:hypothetical protein